MDHMKCNKCKGIRLGSYSNSNLHPCPSTTNLNRNLSPRSTTVGGPGSGDLQTDNLLCAKNRTENAILNRRRNQDRGNVDKDEEDDDKGNYFKDGCSIMEMLQNRRDESHDMGSRAVTRSVVILGLVLMLGVVFGYFVALSNAGRIEVLENEILLMKQAWGNKNSLMKDPSMFSGWVSGKNVWNLFGFWESSIDSPSVLDDGKNPEVGRGWWWYKRFANLFGGRNSTNPLDDRMSGDSQ